MPELCGNYEQNIKLIVAIVAYIHLEWFLGKYTQAKSVLGLLSIIPVTLIVGMLVLFVYAYNKLKGEIK